MEETLLTLHPQGKKGVNISRAKYDSVRAAIIAALSAHGSLTFIDLARAVDEQLRGTFDGSVKWYVTIVKLDMEARRELFRIEKSRPQRISLS